jgi:hypothetical protein
MYSPVTPDGESKPCEEDVPSKVPTALQQMPLEEPTTENSQQHEPQVLPQTAVVKQESFSDSSALNVSTSLQEQVMCHHCLGKMWVLTGPNSYDACLHCTEVQMNCIPVQSSVDTLDQQSPTHELSHATAQTGRMSPDETSGRLSKHSRKNLATVHPHQLWEDRRDKDGTDKRVHSYWYPMGCSVGHYTRADLTVFRFFPPSINAGYAGLDLDMLR